MSRSLSKRIIIFESESKQIGLTIDIASETLWARQNQIAELFGIDRSVATKHIKKIFSDDEINLKSNVQKMHIANSDKLVTYYSLDVVLAVGYRSNTKKAIKFRQWANKVLKSYILRGYSVNKRLIRKNYKLFNNAVEDIKKLLPTNSNSVSASGVVDIVNTFAQTWLSLDAYDKSLLPKKGFTLKKLDISAEELVNGIAVLKSKLVKDNTASELFARERSNGSLRGIIRSIYQSFGGSDMYKSVEERAANLLYWSLKTILLLMVTNAPVRLVFYGIYRKRTYLIL